MREISPALLLAQQSSSHLPYVKVVASDCMTGVNRLHWERLYTGNEAEGYHGLTVAGDGSLNRVRISPTADSAKLYRQRVANPSPQSNFSVWVETSQYNCQSAAIASKGAEVGIFWMTLNRELKVIWSNNYGVTWSSPILLDYVPSMPVSGLTAAYKPNGDIAIFFTGGNMLYAKKRVSGNWQGKVSWDKITGELAGVAAVYDGDWNLIVAGKETAGNAKIWSTVLGDGDDMAVGSWSALQEIASAPADSGYAYGNVFLDKPDVRRLFYVEKYTGQAPATRVYWTYAIEDSSFIDNLWREPVPCDNSNGYGLAITHFGDYAWLSTPDGVWRASLSGQTLELTGDITSVRCEQQSDTGALKIELNNDGKYNACGNGSLPVLDIGCELEVSPGYIVSNGNEVSHGLTFWLEACEHLGENKAKLVLNAIDGWRLLTDWHARRQFRWNMDTEEASVQQILAFVLARVGLKLEVKSASTLMTEFYPDFTIHPGDGGTTIVKKLLSFVPDVVFIEGDRAYLVHPQSTDAAVYSYGQAHTVYQGKYRPGALSCNQVEVTGYDPNTGDVIVASLLNWEQVNRFSDRLHTVTDRNIESLTQANSRGEAILHKAEMGAIGGEVQVPVNCGQQMYDVIEITDANAGLSAVKRRVVGQILTYQPGKAVYTQQLLLGGV